MIDKRRLNVALPRAEYEALKAVCEAHNTSMAKVVTRLVHQFNLKQNRNKPESFEQSLQDSKRPEVRRQAQEQATQMREQATQEPDSPIPASPGTDSGDALSYADFLDR